MWTRRILIAVVILQVIDCIAAITWPIGPKCCGAGLWATGFITLMPGDLLGPPVVEHLLWRTRAPLPLIGVVSLASSVLLNLAITALLVVIVRGSRRAA